MHNVTILEQSRIIFRFESRIPYGEIALGIES